jgi:hypothetical protein
VYTGTPGGVRKIVTAVARNVGHKKRRYFWTAKAQSALTDYRTFPVRALLVDRIGDDALIDVAHDDECVL